MRIRKAILTGGGRATRLQPITSTINKHLLPLANKPMIFHAIERVVDAGIEEIFINVNPGDLSLKEYIGDGGHWNIRITYFEQTGGPQGLAHVVNEAKRFIGDDPFLFYLSDNIFLGSIRNIVQEFCTGAYDCMLALSEVKDPERFGVPVFDAEGRVIDVIEKPKHPPNNYAVTGLYVYGPNIFFDTFPHIQKSHRGEYEISDIHSQLLKQGKRVGVKKISGYWKDTGKPEDLLVANEVLLDAMSGSDFIQLSRGEPDMHLKGNVYIGAGAKIGRGVTLLGPVLIGENVTLEDCTIGPYVTVGQGGTITQARIERSLILEHVMINCRGSIRNSIIGKHAQVASASDEYVDGEFIIGDKTVIRLR